MEVKQSLANFKPPALTMLNTLSLTNLSDILGYVFSQPEWSASGMSWCCAFTRCTLCLSSSTVLLSLLLLCAVPAQVRQSVVVQSATRRSRLDIFSISRESLEAAVKAGRLALVLAKSLFGAAMFDETYDPDIFADDDDGVRERDDDWLARAFLAAANGELCVCAACCYAHIVSALPCSVAWRGSAQVPRRAGQHGRAARSGLAGCYWHRQRRGGTGGAAEGRVAGGVEGAHGTAGQGRCSGDRRCVRYYRRMHRSCDTVWCRAVSLPSLSLLLLCCVVLRSVVFVAAQKGTLWMEKALWRSMSDEQRKAYFAREERMKAALMRRRQMEQERRDDPDGLTIAGA